MQVQHVHLVQREQVDVLLHLVHGEEVPRDVEHRAATREPWPIDDLPAGTLHPSAIRPSVNSASMLVEEEQCLHAVIKP